MLSSFNHSPELYLTKGLYMKNLNFSNNSNILNARNCKVNNSKKTNTAEDFFYRPKIKKSKYKDFNLSKRKSMKVVSIRSDIDVIPEINPNLKANVNNELETENNIDITRNALISFDKPREMKMTISKDNFIQTVDHLLLSIKNREMPESVTPRINTFENLENEDNSNNSEAKKNKFLNSNKLEDSNLTFREKAKKSKDYYSRRAMLLTKSLWKYDDETEQDSSLMNNDKSNLDNKTNMTTKYYTNANNNNNNNKIKERTSLKILEENRQKRNTLSLGNYNYNSIGKSNFNFYNYGVDNINTGEMKLPDIDSIARKFKPNNKALYNKDKFSGYMGDVKPGKSKAGNVRMM